MKKIISVFSVAVLALFGGVLYLTNRPAKVVYNTSRITDTLIIYEDTQGVTHASIEHDPEAKQEMKAAISKEFYSYTTDTLAPALKIAKEEIDRLTRVNAKLNGQAVLTKTDTIYKTNHFTGKYMTILVSDSAANYSYNATLDFVDYHKKNWLFGRDKYYTDISSPDTAFKIYGVQTYRRPFVPGKDKMKIAATLNMTLGRRPSIKTGFNARFNPDGILSPSVGFGREMFFTGKNGYYIQGGVEFNFYRK